MHLAKASEIVHRAIFVEQNKLSGHFDRDSVVDYVPRCLVKLVSMIEHGPDIESQIENGNAMLKQGIYQLPLSCLCIQEKTYIDNKRWFAAT
jgi:hypothetical protein